MRSTRRREPRLPGRGGTGPGTAASDQGTARLTLHTLATTVASNVALGGVSIVIARALGPSGKGAYDLVLATAALLATALGLSLPAGVTYVVARGRAAVKSIIARAAGLSVVQTAFAALLLVAIRHSPAAPAFLPPDTDASIISATLVFVGLTLLQTVFRAVIIGRKEIVRANHLDVLGRGAQLAFFIVAWGTIQWLDREPRIAHFVWLAVASVALTCVLHCRAAYRDADAPADGARFAEVLKYALISHLGNIANFLNYRLAIFLVGFFLGTTSVGLFTLAVTLSQLHWLVAQAAATVLLPLVASRAGSGDDSALHVAAVTRTTVAITVGLASATAVVAGPLVPWVFGRAFEGSLLPFYLLLPGVVAFVPSIVLAAYFGGHGLPGINVRGSLTGLVAILVLSVVLVPRFGTAGAAVATSGAHLMNSTVLLVAFSRATRVSPWNVLVPRPRDRAALVHALLGPTGAR